MFINLDEQFTDEAGNIYEVENPVDNHYITYLYDKDGEYIIARSDESECFPEFYARGWTKQECHDSLKTDWVIQKGHQVHVGDLEALLPDLNMASWLNLEVWENLPTVEAFEDWLDNSGFISAWEYDPTTSEEECDRDESLIAACEKLDKAMDEDPSLIQAIDPKSKRVEKAAKEI